MAFIRVCILKNISLNKKYITIFDTFR